MCSVAVVIVVMALVAWEGLSALRVQAEHHVAPGSARSGACPRGKSGRIHACPRGSSPVKRESYS
jgi:hypothetical protein